MQKEKRELIKKLVELYWAEGWDGGIDIHPKSWRPYRGFLADPNQKKPKLKTYHTDFGDVREV